jgi:uncharacterized protein YjbI with pentapeptide repeats
MASGSTRSKLPIRSKSPALADQAKDLKALRDVVVDAAAISTGLWLSYIFVLLYLTIAVGGITHRNLFFEDPVKLPFLNVELPLVGFFVLGPVLFLIVHAYVLLHFVLLAGKVGVFHAELQAQILNEQVRAQLRWQLPSNIFVQILAGAREVRRGTVGRMLRLMAQISLVAAPLTLLVLFQIQFLPYHPTPAVALWLRVTVLVDLILLWMLWPSVARGKVTWIRWHDFHRSRAVPVALFVLARTIWRRPWVAPYNRPVRIDWWVLRHVAGRGTVAVAAIASLIPILLVFTISTFPDEWLDNRFRSVPVLAKIHELLFAGVPDLDLRRPGWFSNRLILTDQSFVDADKLNKVDVSHSFRERDLNDAVLSGADVRKADFTRARLQGAIFEGARLQGAIFNKAELQATDFRGAQLQGANLKQAKLQGALLRAARLEGAVLTLAELEGADLRGAQLQGANISLADLRGATLGLDAPDPRSDFSEGERSAEFFLDFSEKLLPGWDLREVQLQGADLYDAQLQGANLDEAQLQGADLRGAELEGASLRKVGVWRLRALQDDIKIDLLDLDKCDPDTMPWQGMKTGNSTFTGWRDDVIQSIPEGEFRNYAKARLSALDLEKEPKDLIRPEFWKLACSTLDEEHTRKVTMLLADLACSSDSAPYLALGLLNGLIRRAWSQVATIANRIRTSNPATCHGVVGFTDTDWAAVDEVIADPSALRKPSEVDPFGYSYGLRYGPYGPYGPFEGGPRRRRHAR